MKGSTDKLEHQTLTELHRDLFNILVSRLHTAAGVATMWLARHCCGSCNLRVKLNSGSLHTQKAYFKGRLLRFCKKGTNLTSKNYPIVIRKTGMGGDRTLFLINAWLFYNLHAKTRPLETLVGGRPWNIEWLKVNRAFSKICDTDRLHILLLLVELKKTVCSSLLVFSARLTML